MKNFSTLHRFGYSVKLSVDVVSLIPYLSNLYEETGITESEASDSVFSAVNDLPVSYHVRVYNNKESCMFRDECHIYSNWSYTMVNSMVEEIKTMDENQYMFFADDRDELVQMINDIVNHCKEFGFHGEFTKITLHTCPIDHGYQAF